MKKYSSRRTLDLQHAGFLRQEPGDRRSIQICLLMVFSFWITTLMMGVENSSAADNRLDCPQPRFTKQAPKKIYRLVNPLKKNPENIKKGKILYLTRAKPMPCKHCHGINGDGRGSMSSGFNPPPRNFTCAKTIHGIPDGQLFWVIKNGSHGTGMLAFKDLQDEQVWQLILFIREFAK